MSWEERMSAKAAERKLTRWLESDQGKWVTEQRAAEPWRYDPTPPDDDMCRDCFEWRRAQPGQEHFGYAWWTICREGSWHRQCRFEHDHHDGEIALASAV